jgi:hypothetical protein
MERRSRGIAPLTGYGDQPSRDLPHETRTIVYAPRPVRASLSTAIFAFSVWMTRAWPE